MTSVIARIVLRYGAAHLVTSGWLSPDDATTLAMDADLLMLVGLGLGAVAEGWMILAKKMGWESK